MVLRYRGSSKGSDKGSARVLAGFGGLGRRVKGSGFI